MRPSLPHRLTASLAPVLYLSLSFGLVAADGLAAEPPLNSVTPSRVVVQREHPGQPIDPAHPASRALVARAAADPHVRFIVGLESDVSVEDALSYGPDAGDVLAEASQRAQQAFVGRMAAHFLGHGPHHYEEIPGLPYVRVALTPGGVEALLRDPGVLSINTESGGTTALDVSVPFTGANYLHTYFGFGGYTGSGHTIAVIDSGVHKTHPMFSGKVVSEACYSSPSGTFGPLCHGGLPHGSTATGAGEPCSSPGSLNCNGWHGSHAAGAALGALVEAKASENPVNQARWLKGMAPNASLISMQVMSVSSSQSICGEGNTPCIVVKEGDLALALQRVHALRYTYSIAAVNLSVVLTLLAADYDEIQCDNRWPLVRDAVALLDKAGIPVIAASGNQQLIFGFENKLAPPACLSRVIAVAATPRNSHQIAPYANKSPLLELLAPGGLVDGGPQTATCLGTLQNFPAGVMSAYPGGACKYLQVHGTSLAAPHAAGGLAVLRGRYPFASHLGLLNQIRYTGNSVRITQSHTPDYFRPSLNLQQAADQVLPAPSAPGAVVTGSGCYGSYLVSWNPASGLIPGYFEYQIEGSASSSFSNATRYYVGNVNQAQLSVFSTTYFRVRACNGVSCGTWRNFGPLAYSSGCP